MKYLVRLAAIGGVLIGASVLAACTSGPTTDVAQSRTWQREGAILIGKYRYASSYESLPITVNGSQPRNLDVGPVSPLFSLNRPEVFVYTTPPDAQFGFRTVRGPTMTTINGRHYIQLHVKFLGFNGTTPSYDGYRLWFSVSR